jgi:pimeloyl-ACP methyl ester carboxylesterase
MSERLIDLPPFSFWEYRSGRGTPVVLIHGLSGSRRWWSKNIEELSRHHLVASVDLVGFGRNRRFFGRSQLPLPFEDVAALLGRWIDTSFDEPVHLVGHSMGGQIAIHLAAARPDVVRSLTLVNSTGQPFEIDPMSHLKNLLQPVPHGVLSFSRVLVWDFLRAGPISVAVATARLLTSDARRFIDQVHVPTLLVWGDRDPIVPDRYAESMKKRIEESDLIILPKAGHVAMWDNAEVFNERVLDFFDTVEGEQGDEPRPEPRSQWGLSGSASGLTYRCSGGRDNPVILLHGLGVSTTYFRPLARELLLRGVNAIGPDLPGFGYSLELQVDAAHDGEALIQWARELGITSATWVGQSTGCQALEQVQALAPELVSKAIFISPIWSRLPNVGMRLVSKLMVDAVLESPMLVATAAAAYWKAGFIRFMKAWMFYVKDAQRRREFPTNGFMIAGSDDPLLDRDELRRLTGGRISWLSGAHAVHWRNAAGVAEEIAYVHGAKP